MGDSESDQKAANDAFAREERERQEKSEADQRAREEQERINKGAEEEQRRMEDRDREQERTNRTQASQFDGSNMCNPPSLDDIKKFTYKPETSDIASEEQIKAIGERWKEYGLEANKIAQAAWDIARHCADVGSSKEGYLQGVGSGLTIPRENLAAYIRLECTLRQFCAYYAKIVFNHMWANKTPPANWAKWGIRFEDRYVAFDFVHGVTSSASLNPKGGLLRELTHSELVAAQTMKQIKIFHQVSKQDQSSSTFTEVTGGRRGPKARLMIKGGSSSGGNN